MAMKMGAQKKPCRCEVCALLRLGFIIIAPDGTRL